MQKLLIITQKVDRDDQLLGFFIDWIRGFSAQFDKVTILCLERGKFELPGNVRVISMGKEIGRAKILQLVSFYFHIWHKRRDYDSVFVHMNPIWVVLGWKVWFILKKKVFLWYAHKKITTKLKLAEMLSSGIFTSTPEGFRLKSKKVSVVGQGINTEIFKPDLNRRKTGLNILCVGRIAPSKNLEAVVAAAKILHEEGQDFSVTVIGEPALSVDKEYESEIRNRIHRFGLEEKFNFLGKISHRDLPGHYQSHQIFINTGTTGSLDKTIIEAMASGCIVISSNDAAKKFLPSDLVLLSNDPIELATKIKIQSRIELRQELVDYAVKNHSLSSLVNKITDIIKKYGK